MSLIFSIDRDCVTWWTSCFVRWPCCASCLVKNSMGNDSARQIFHLPWVTSDLARCTLCKLPRSCEEESFYTFGWSASMEEVRNKDGMKSKRSKHIVIPTFRCHMLFGAKSSQQHRRSDSFLPAGHALAKSEMHACARS